MLWKWWQKIFKKWKKWRFFQLKFTTCDTFFTKKNIILKKILHMGDLEKNDKIFRKKSRHVFCKQIYQIHHCKYENDHPHHCKYLPIFISFTIDNVVDNKFVWCIIYHLKSFKINIFHKRLHFTTVNTKSVVLTTVNTYRFSKILPLVMAYLQIVQFSVCFTIVIF